MPFHKALRYQTQWLVLTESLALIALIGWIDYVTGFEWSFFVFYALPIVLVVSKAARPLGFVFALLCAMTWVAAHIESHPYRTNWGFALAAASRLFYFGVVVVAAAAVKDRRELDSRRIEALERARELEGEILRTSEREQQRIGRDLHDGLGPHLAAIGYAATFLANELRLRDLPETAKAEQIRELVREAVSLTRDLARGLIPVGMDASGLAVALEELASTSSRLSGMSVTFCETGDPLVADPQDALHLYRIAQEAINNAARHGAASRVTILLYKSAEVLRLMIADDGKGLAPSQNGARGIGLHSMEYRVHALGGKIEIRSQPNEGTTVSCEIPLRPSGPTPAVP